MVNELSKIRNELLKGLEKRDSLYIEMQINKIDTLIYNANKDNNTSSIIKTVFCACKDKCSSQRTRVICKAKRSCKHKK